MTDTRNLLEMAAKACGMGGYVFEQSPNCFTGGSFCGMVKPLSPDWKPHTDDGDNSRMRTKLRIDVTWLINSVRCENWNGEIGETEYFDRHNNDPDAALRLCALRVAAQMGEQM